MRDTPGDIGNLHFSKKTVILLLFIQQRHLLGSPNPIRRSRRVLEFRFHLSIFLFLGVWLKSTVSPLPLYFYFVPDGRGLTKLDVLTTVCKSKVITTFSRINTFSLLRVGFLLTVKKGGRIFLRKH